MVESDPIVRVCRFIENHLEEPLTLATLGRQVGWSPFHLQRRFKAVVGVTPRQYADECRAKVFRGQLRSGSSVTRAMMDAGYGSSSRLYERAGAQLGMTPGAYQRGGKGAVIGYQVVATPIGLMLVAGSERGVCAIQFGSSQAALERSLRDEFPEAELVRDNEALEPWVGALQRHLAGRDKTLHLPLDVRSTAFQRRVWEYLQSIPYGETRSYSEVARAIGRPSATRAVARACATNPVAVAVPCHRVVGKNGKLTGYRWGLDRKEALLAWEGRARNTSRRQ